MSSIDMREIRRKAAELAEAGKVAEASRAFQKAIGYNPENSDLHYSFGRFLQNWEGDEKALAAFRRAAHLNPLNMHAQRQTGRTLAILNRPKEAEFHLGAAALLLKAAHSREPAVEKRRNLARTLNRLGECYEQMELPAFAHACYQKSVNTCRFNERSQFLLRQIQRAHPRVNPERWDAVERRLKGLKPPPEPAPVSLA